MHNKREEKVVHENLHNETEIRPFLLGEMPAEARSAFEEKFIADESLFEQISIAEDELIESYLRGTLSPAEKISFEREFLSTEPRRRRVRFARTMLAKLAEQNELVAAKKTETMTNPSVWDKLANFFKFPKLVFGAALTLLILIFGGWLLLRNTNQPEIAGQTSPPTVEPSQNQNLPLNRNAAVNLNTNATQQNVPDNKNDLPNDNRTAPNVNQNPDRLKQDSPAVTPVLALFTGATRANGKISTLNFPENAVGAKLRLNLESQDYKIYSVEIVNPDGKLIFKNSNLKSQNSKINFFIPAQKLQTGDYIVKLSALNWQHENESVADYAFRVKRK
ncbi:MAG: hypothetical protein ABJA66_04530 [Actinomycetota bacterium]